MKKKGEEEIKKGRCRRKREGEKKGGGRDKERKM